MPASAWNLPGMAPTPPGRSRLRRIELEHLPLPGLRVRPERLLKEGDPATAILAAAEETGCDLIVMGTHGWKGEVRKLMGSVAEEVMQKAPCPVVAVKVPLPKPPP